MWRCMPFLQSLAYPRIPPEVYDEAATFTPSSASKGLDQAEIAKRRDMRDVLTMTIDPHDAKDFDDALSMRS